MAPRCSFANVTVNGIHRGVYTNIEPIKKPFLMRVFGNDAGDLYEGTVADLSDGNLIRLQKKTNEDDVGNTIIFKQLNSLLLSPITFLNQEL